MAAFRPHPVCLWLLFSLALTVADLISDLDAAATSELAARRGRSRVLSTKGSFTLSGSSNRCDQASGCGAERAGCAGPGTTSSRTTTS